MDIGVEGRIRTDDELTLWDLQSHPFGLSGTSTSYVGVHESSAEAVGFEPTAPVRVLSLSKGVL